MYLGECECLDRFLIHDCFLLSLCMVWSPVAMWHSCLLHLCYASNFDLICHSLSLLCLTYSIIFIDASQESCFGTVVTEHYLTFQSITYQNVAYTVTHLYETELRECMCSLSPFAYRNIKLIQTMHVGWTNHINYPSKYLSSF